MEQNKNSKTTTHNTAKKPSSLVSKLGWAVAILCMVGLFWTLKQNNSLTNALVKHQIENVALKEENKQLTTTNASLQTIHTIVTSKEYTKHTLAGNQAVAPQAVANAFINKNTNTTYIDISALPKAPEGKAYQAWSLQLDPLMATSLGLLKKENFVGNGFYKFDSLPNKQAIGITLENKNGATSPSMSKLYSLGEL